MNAWPIKSRCDVFEPRAPFGALVRVYCASVGEAASNAACTDIDWQDICAAVDGDGDAYQRLVMRYQTRIGRYIWRFARNAADWELLVQDVFVEAYFSLGGFRGRGPFEAWLKQIATRLGYRYWKQQAKNRQHQPLEHADIQRMSATIEDDLEAGEAAELLHRVLATLAPRDRLVLTLQYFEQLDTQQIAQRTGWSRSMVKVQAHRARNRLATQLQAAGVEL